MNGKNEYQRLETSERVTKSSSDSIALAIKTDINRCFTCWSLTDRKNYEYVIKYVSDPETLLYQITVSQRIHHRKKCNNNSTTCKCFVHKIEYYDAVKHRNALAKTKEELNPLDYAIFHFETRNAACTLLTEEEMRKKIIGFLKMGRSNIIVRDLPLDDYLRKRQDKAKLIK
jgi:hypothetical protein